LEYVGLVCKRAIVIMVVAVRIMDAAMSDNSHNDV
jgi:hypothetical protein